MSTQSPVLLKDLAYDLRLLLGADQIVSFIEADNRFGNLVNYFKDSVYLHARNLLNALTNGYETEIGQIPASITSALYGKVKGSLEVYVAHQETPRSKGRVQYSRWPRVEHLRP